MTTQQSSRTRPGSRPRPPQASASQHRQQPIRLTWWPCSSLSTAPRSSSSMSTGTRAWPTALQCSSVPHCCAGMQGDALRPPAEQAGLRLQPRDPSAGAAQAALWRGPAAQLRGAPAAAPCSKLLAGLTTVLRSACVHRSCCGTCQTASARTPTSRSCRLRPLLREAGGGEPDSALPLASAAADLGAACRPPDVSDTSASIVSSLFWPKLPEEPVKLHPKVRIVAVQCSCTQ